MDEQTARAPAGRATHGMDWRDRVLADPGMILEDRDVMRALVAADARRLGDNVIDMRGAHMDGLETRLRRLEDTHRTVVAAAYENLAGTNLIHRALLMLLEAEGFAAFLDVLAYDVAEVLRVDAVRLVLEATDAGAAPHPAVVPVGAGFVAAHRATGGAARRVVLRGIEGGAPRLYDRAGAALRSEACLALDLGAGRPPAMLCLAAEDPDLLSGGQGTDLLAFFAQAVERLIAGHLSR